MRHSRFTNGLVLGTYGSSGGQGITLGTGAAIYATGPPTQPHWIVRYSTVQEPSATN